MRREHEYLATVPFDLYGLTVFRLVAENLSFSKAALEAGLTQSAISRQIATMESKLGIRLFDRTTRVVRLTEAGRELSLRTQRLVSDTGEILRTFQESQQLRPPLLRIGIARSIGLAYLPGFFFAFQKKHPQVLLNVEQRSSREILQALDEGQLDAGLVCPPNSLPRSLMATHHFRDDFTLILPPNFPNYAKAAMSVESARRLLAEARWLLLDAQSHTGKLLRSWLDTRRWPIQPAMELDSFDTIMNLVALGLGVSLVPHRILALYGRRRTILRVNLKPRFSRTLAVVVRKTPRPTGMLGEFVKNVLF